MGGGNTLSLAAVHVIRSGFDLPYLQVPYEQELTRSQRYYAKSFATATAPAQNAGAVGAATLQAPYAYAAGLSASTLVKLPRTMFWLNDTVAPTVTLYSPNDATANCYNATKTADAGAASVINLGPDGFLLSCLLASGGASGDQLQAHWVVQSAGLF